MKKALFLFLLVSSFLVFADGLPRLHIFHINGVNTTKAEAEDNMRALEKTAGINSNFLVSEYGTGHFDLIYNQTHGAFLDIAWDTLGKKFKEKQPISLDDYVHAYMEQHPDKKVPDGTLEYNKLKQDIEGDYKNMYFSQTNFDDVLNKFHNKVPPQLANIVKYLQSFKTNASPYDYSNDKLDGILLIPHSQGNLYANDLYNWLVTNEKFYMGIIQIQIFGIANPASIVGNGSEATIMQTYPSRLKTPDLPLDPYYTADDDGVINMLRVFTLLPKTSEPLPANAHLEGCKDFPCHSLIKAYLNDSKSRVHIQYMITVMMDALIGELISDVSYDNNIGDIEYGKYGPGSDPLDTSHLILKDGVGNVIIANDMPQVPYLTYYRPSIITGLDSIPTSDILFNLDNFPAGTYTVYANLNYDCESNKDIPFMSMGSLGETFNTRIKKLTFYEPTCEESKDCQDGKQERNYNGIPNTCGIYKNMKNLDLIRQKFPYLFDPKDPNLVVDYKIEIGS